MKKKLIFIVILLSVLRGGVIAQNIYESIGKQAELLTLSNGQFQEFFPNDTFVRIGTVLLNTQTHEIVDFITLEDTTAISAVEADVASRFLSVDPIGREYPELTPYQFASNTPIQAIDLDGLEGAPHRKDFNLWEWASELFRDYFFGVGNSPNPEDQALSEEEKQERRNQLNDALPRVQKFSEILKNANTKIRTSISMIPLVGTATLTILDLKPYGDNTGTLASGSFWMLVDGFTLGQGSKITFTESVRKDILKEAEESLIKIGAPSVGKDKALGVIYMRMVGAKTYIGITLEKAKNPLRAVYNRYFNNGSREGASSIMNNLVQLMTVPEKHILGIEAVLVERMNALNPTKVANVKKNFTNITEQSKKEAIEWLNTNIPKWEEMWKAQ